MNLITQTHRVVPVRNHTRHIPDRREIERAAIRATCKKIEDELRFERELEAVLVENMRETANV